MSDTKETRGTLTEAELRAEFEYQHEGRNLKQHKLRGTYISAPIAALWNQHKRTAIWMQSRALASEAARATPAAVEPDMRAVTEDRQAVVTAERAIRENPGTTLSIVRRMQAELDAARAAPQCHVPEGWKLVPDVGAKVRFSESEYVIFALGDKPGTFDLQPANGRHGDRWLNVPPAAFDPAFPTSPAIGADQCVDDNGKCGVGGYCDRCPITANERASKEAQ